MFATDRDLLGIEPGVFGDLAWAGQTLVSGTATILGTLLTAATQDVGFEDAGIDAGHVVLVGGVGYEVLARLGVSTLSVSKLRPSTADDPLPASVVSAAAMRVSTFAPQLGIVHAQVLRMLGLVRAGSSLAMSATRVSEATVLNGTELARLEALGALHLAYSSASAVLGPESAPGKRAAHYAELYDEERRRSAAILDLDGDGIADATRRPGVVILGRG